VSDIDHGIAATIGAALGGFVVGIDRVVSYVRGKKKTDPPPLPPPPPEPSANAVRMGALAQRQDQLESAMSIFRHETATTLDAIREDLGELKENHAATAAILPRVEKSIDDLRDTLRRRPNTEKE
jgi:hypothetical protein